MREILKQYEELRSKLVGEAEQLMFERVMMRDISSARSRELHLKRDEEFRRVERWSENQKAVIADVFAAMIAECDADTQKHEVSIGRFSASDVAPKETVIAKQVQPGQTAHVSAPSAPPPGLTTALVDIKSRLERIESQHSAAGDGVQDMRDYARSRP